MEKKLEADTRLSYSSASLLTQCSMKYWHRKVNNTPVDSDIEQDTEAFRIGKAFHDVLERTMHTSSGLETALAIAVKQHEVEYFEGMIHAMLLRYLQVHGKSGLTAVKCELGLSNDQFIGFIDVILKDDEGNWWIADLKTASRVTDTTFARLPRDRQLNLYASFAHEVAGVLDLDIEKFKGCRYRVTTKSNLKKKASESYEAHVKRTAKNVKSYDVIIPIEVMNPSEFYKVHMVQHEVTMKLRAGEIAPSKNFGACESYFKPCEYWSQCMGCTFSEGKAKAQMLTTDNV